MKKWFWDGLLIFAMFVFICGGLGAYASGIIILAWKYSPWFNLLWITLPWILSAFGNYMNHLDQKKLEKKLEESRRND